MVWTFMGNTRMYNALRDYGDSISQIGLFSFKVRATGEIYETGVSISSMMTYINRYPHIKWLLTVANDGTNSIFKALRDNTNGAQDMFDIKGKSYIGTPFYNDDGILLMSVFDFLLNQESLEF